MTLELTGQQQKILVESIESYVSDLRMEIADTENMDYREMLKERKEVLVAIINGLETTEPTSVTERP